MLRTRLSRLAPAVAAAVLLVPALAPAAQAAPTPKVPSLAAATKVYPHLAGGTYVASPIDKVRAPAKKCGKTKRVKGATGNTATYIASDGSITAAKPAVIVIAYRLPSAAKAKKMLASALKRTKKCPGGGLENPGVKSAKVKKFKVRLGSTSFGYTFKATMDDGTKYTGNMVQVRKGKHIVMTTVGAFDGKVPSVKKTVKMARVAVKAAS